ncbi:hypothetical protein BC834DRAFT_44839 [Gloeopeniophorella convolvens]|nr:hypothetical protein BC834DRAFT_44839 [Gloeopeniophorella convolvens]
MMALAPALVDLAGAFTSIRMSHEGDHDQNGNIDSSALLHRHGTLKETSCPISSLPVETLRTIFLHVRLLYDYGLHCILWPRVDNPTTWTAVTHVCAHWRRVAEQYPELWEYIPLSNPNWTQRALLLSRPRPITVQMQPGRHLSAESLRLALRELPRIRVLWLSDQRLGSGEAEERKTSVMQIFFSSVGSRLADAAALEELHVGAWVHDPPPVRAPDSAPLPRLRSLFVAGMPLPALGCLQQRLTHLSLENCKPWEFMTQMLDTLATLPSLERLCIKRHVLPTRFIETCGTPRVVSLSYLQCLDIIGSYHELFSLLNALRFPEEGELHLRLMGMMRARNIDATITALAGIVTHHYSSPVRFQRLAIATDSQRANYWTLRGAVVAGRAVPCLLNFVAHSGPRPIVSYMAMLLGLLPVAESLRHLDVAIAEGPAAGNIWACLAPLTRGVEYVGAVGAAAGELIHALRGVGNDPRGSLLPCMSTLCISITVFPETQGQHTQDILDVEPLLDAAKAWHTAGMPLQITFRKCHVSAMLVDLLKKVLGQEAVAWDGIEAVPELEYMHRTYRANFE